MEGLMKLAKGSPGDNFMMMKERIVMPMITGIETSNRLEMYFTMRS